MGRRDELLGAAAGLFRERGYYGVGMQDIGRAAGIVGSGVYRHFESKEALLAELIAGLLDDLVEGAARCRAEHPADPATALDALVDLHLDFALDRESLIAVYLREELHLPEADRRRARRKQRAYLQSWVDVLRELRPEVDEREGHLVVQAVVSLLNSVAWQRPAVPRARAAERLRRMAREALELAPALEVAPR